MDMKHLDLAGIGIGPFNLGLAALISQHTELSSVFLDRRPEFRWHEGLLLDGTKLQVPFLADLVTMADPTHPLSYLSYLHQQDRLYKFYYYDTFQIPRREYDHYCRWASRQLPACQFDADVCDVRYEAASGRFLVESRSSSGASERYAADNLAIGIGTAPFLPNWARLSGDARVMHSAEFAGRQSALEQYRRVTVVGSGQSAAECVLALYSALTPERVAAGASVQWVTQAAGFHPMEYSKLGQECFTPAYMEYFHSIPREKRRDIVAKQGLLYKGISFSTIADIFDLLYERSIGGQAPGLSLYSNCEVIAVASKGAKAALQMSCRHRQLDQFTQLETDAIVAATGYRHVWPEWFERLKGTVLATDEQGDCIVQADFSALRCDEGFGHVFVQNAEIFQHGVGSPDLGIAATRNALIMNQLLGRPHYRTAKHSAFQSFGLIET